MLGQWGQASGNAPDFRVSLNLQGHCRGWQVSALRRGNPEYEQKDMAICKIIYFTARGLRGKIELVTNIGLGETCMPQIALVSITLNAVNPIVDYFHKHAPQWKIMNYLDSNLTSRIHQDGGVRPSSMGRMFDMLSHAAEDGADVILITCTVFSAYADDFSRLLGIPVVSPDRSMLRAVAEQDGKAAILYTFSGTLENTRKLYYECRRSAGRREAVDMILVELMTPSAGGMLKPTISSFRPRLWRLIPYTITLSWLRYLWPTLQMG